MNDTPLRVGAELKRQLDYFRTVQDQLAATNHNKVALVHANRVCGTYESEVEAWTAARRKGYAPGAFLIRRCLHRSEETPVRCRSQARF